jgi:hypothetical protein
LRNAHTIGSRAAGRGTLTRAIYELCGERGMTMPQIAQALGAPSAKDIAPAISYMTQRGYLKRLTRLNSATQRWRGLYVQGAAVPGKELPRAAKDSFASLALATGGAGQAMERAAAPRPTPLPRPLPIAARTRPALPELHKAFRMALPLARPSDVRTVRATDSIGTGFFTSALRASVACAPMVEHRLALPGAGISGSVFDFVGE